MARVLLVGNGVPKSVETKATTWGELKAELNGVESFSSMNATDFGTKLSYSNDDAVLNFVDGVAKIYLSPIKGFKGGLGYAELKSALKELRVEAVTNEDEEVVSLIGNYTQCTTEELQRRYDAVHELLNTRNVKAESTEFNSEELEELRAEILATKNRIGQIELRLNMLNEHNQDLFIAEAKAFGENLK